MLHPMTKSNDSRTFAWDRYDPYTLKRKLRSLAVFFRLVGSAPVTPRSEPRQAGSRPAEQGQAVARAAEPRQAVSRAAEPRQADSRLAEPRHRRAAGDPRGRNVPMKCRRDACFRLWPIIHAGGSTHSLKL